MKKIIFLAFICIFVLGIVVVSTAGDNCGKEAKKACASKASKSCASKGSKSSCCPGTAKTASVDKLSDKGAQKSLSCSSKGSHAAKNLAGEKSHCPDVSSRAALDGFHESMHPMHVALNEKDFDSIREKLPSLIKASKNVSDYKCASSDKCSDSCLDTFKNRRAGLIESVEKLKVACKGKDNELVTASFDGMHEAYITFANTCSSH